MAKKKEVKHPLDEFAERMETLADKPVAQQEPSPDFWEIRLATDPSVGNYPQTVTAKDVKFGDNGGLDQAGFPNVAVPAQKFQRGAKWTDVMSANLWSGGYMLNDAALAVFKGLKLGEHREYPVQVTGPRKETRAMTYLFIKNMVTPDKVDFAKSKWSLASILGMPTQPIEVKSFDDWLSKQQLATEGKLEGCRPFSRVTYLKLVLKPKHRPKVDFFELERFGATYFITTKAKEVIEQAGLSGLEFKANRRLFAGR